MDYVSLYCLLCKKEPAALTGEHDDIGPAEYTKMHE